MTVLMTTLVISLSALGHASNDVSCYVAQYYEVTPAGPQPVGGGVKFGCVGKTMRIKKRDLASYATPR